MSFLIISTSLNPGSRSALLAKECFHMFQAEKQLVEWIDLRELELPQCDGDKCYSHKNVGKLQEAIKKADCIIMSVAIYNYDCGSSAKNLVELTGRAWTDKVVGFICAAGGKSSYMSVMQLANSLMLDFRSIVIPRFVYAEGSAFQGDEIADEQIVNRLKELVKAAIKLEKIQQG